MENLDQLPVHTEQCSMILTLASIKALRELFRWFKNDRNKPIPPRIKKMLQEESATLKNSFPVGNVGKFLC